MVAYFQWEVRKIERGSEGNMLLLTCVGTSSVRLEVAVKCMNGLLVHISTQLLRIPMLER
jgi:hypothetical protein